MNASTSYYPANKHRILRDEETGSGFWSVTGNNLQFTRFEVPPHSHFSTHSHTSEQITYLLEGVLFFKIEDEVYKVAAGDCIVIPSNKQHSVWTENEGAKAVDAWSPVNEKYLAIKK
jgi:quercetin dioxygenase-like cupin family protein